MFVVFEGIDGCGKSTQSKQLVENLNKHKGIKAIWTREPGGSPIAEAIRNVLVNGDPESMDPQTELLLFNAARRNHLQKTILPALEEGHIVVCDRYLPSTLAFQSDLVRGDKKIIDDILLLHRAYCNVNPDITFWLDVSIDEANKRMGDKTVEARFESKGSEFQLKTYQNYFEMLISPRFKFLNMQRIEANRTPSEIAEDVLNAVFSKLKAAN